MSGQLILDLPVRAALGRTDFMISPSNAVAVAAVDGWRGWPQGKLVLVGAEGSGKSHLTAVWAAETGAAVVCGAMLADADLVALAEAPAVAVEDADRVAGHPAREAALFHLHNLLAEARRPLLLTARTVGRDWGLSLPDLASRVQAAPVARLDPPDDALLGAVLVKLFADRQVRVTPSAIRFLCARMTRSLAEARDLVAAMDARALAERRPLTRELARRVLAEGG
ncbi:MAG: chromosomal replication initiator DnaA [Gemmobacter sp.]